MRSLPILKPLAMLGGVLLSGCLVSETPILDASNGVAEPVKPGAYVMCSLSDEENDCQNFDIVVDETGLYQFIAEDEEPTHMRFRRVGRRGYAVQSLEDEDDAYMYYYGRGNSERFTLTMMLCADLPDALRSDLIEEGDLQSDDENFDTCSVNTLDGLVASARAYHRGEIDNEDGIAMEITQSEVEQ